MYQSSGNCGIVCSRENNVKGFAKDHFDYSEVSGLNKISPCVPSLTAMAADTGPI